MQWRISEFKRGERDASGAPVVQLQVDVLAVDGSVYARGWITVPESTPTADIQTAAIAAARNAEAQETARRSVEQNIIGMGGAL